jgi:head-tail adaptor
VHLLTLENPGGAVQDSDGAYSETWTALEPPALWAEIRAANARDLERLVAGTVQSTASHLLIGDFHAQVTTKTRITKGARDSAGALEAGAREFQVTGVHNVEERDRQMIVAVVEVVA